LCLRRRLTEPPVRLATADRYVKMLNHSVRISMSSDSTSLLDSTVLVVDDTPANLDLVVEFLEAQGLRVATAGNGEECLQRAESVRPDIILLDVVMPDLNGFEVAQRLKGLPAMRDTPIIFMTALTGLQEKIRGFEVGGVDYVTKPLQIEEVRARVITHLRLHLAERAERTRRAAAEQRYRRLFEAATDGILLLDAHTGIIIDANPAMLRLIREESKSVIGTRLWDLGAFLSVCESPAAYREMLELAESSAYDGVLLPRGGKRVDVAIATSTFQAGPVRIFQCNVRDVSERNRLRRGMLEATDSEQLRLAQEIHDGLGQELAGLDLLTHGLLKHVQREQVPEVVDLERMTQITRQALSTCHDIAHGLSPLSSTAGGLVEALQALKGRLGGPPGPAVELEIDRRSEISVAIDVCSHLYRIAQEAVANAIKHSGAKRIEIRLRVDPKAVELSVSDDGCGMDKTGTGRKGLGCQTMRDRAASIGATLNLKTEPGGGTKVVCQVPQSARGDVRKRIR
jgi:PAS domain S-box-containing protein